MIGEIKVLGGSAHPELARDICKHLGIEQCPSSLVRFSNENLLVQVEENVREADVFVVQPSCAPVSDGGGAEDTTLWRSRNGGTHI